MIAGCQSALLVPQQAKWELAFFGRPPISVFPSRRELRFLAGRPATRGTIPARLATFATVRPDATILTHSFASSAKTHLPKCFVSRPPAELGLLSLLFVISMAMGAFLSMAVTSLPTMSAFRRLAVSMEKLSKVASEEVPGTLSSLKLSGMEINDLTQQLSGLRNFFFPLLAVRNDPDWASFFASPEAVAMDVFDKKNWKEKALLRSFSGPSNA